jgi:hypothetical protein
VRFLMPGMSWLAPVVVAHPARGEGLVVVDFQPGFIVHADSVPLQHFLDALAPARHDADLISLERLGPAMPMPTRAELAGQRHGCERVTERPAG